MTLQFHSAGVLLGERVAGPAQLSGMLSDLLESMSPRTRRPIRFLEPEIDQTTTTPSPLETDPAQLTEADSQPPPEPASVQLSQSATRH